MEKLTNIFTGRVSRRTFLIAELFIGLPRSLLIGGLESVFGKILSFIVLGFVLLIFEVRRLHDIGKRGTMAILLFVPGINELLFLYLWLKNGDPEENIYGPVPMR